MRMHDDATRVTVSPVVPGALGILCALAGLGLGFVAPAVSTWAVDTLPAVPGPLELLAGLTTAWTIPLLTVVGIGAGLFRASTAIHESLALTVDSEGVLLTQDERDLYVPRAKIGSVFREGRDLVLLDSAERELARRKADDLNDRAVADAFTAHGYPWSEKNTHEESFTRWIEGHPGLDEQTHALLRERREALSGKDTHLATALHEQLQELGVVVRDRGRHQEYRRLA